MAILWVWIILSAAALASIIAGWVLIFRKAGINPGKFFIPFYGGYLAYDIADCGGLFIVQLLFGVIFTIISLVTTVSPLTYLIFGGIEFVFFCIFCTRLSDTFEEGVGVAACLILFYPVVIFILGYCGSQITRGAYKAHTVIQTWTCSKCNATNLVSRITCQECGEKKPQLIMSPGQQAPVS